jgi:hypothetical protein
MEVENLAADEGSRVQSTAIIARVGYPGCANAAGSGTAVKR